jgi:hypothetical protein
VRSLVTLLQGMRRNHALMLTGVVMFTLLVYFAMISVGKFNLRWPIQMLFYDQLADGFRSGHLYLPHGPDPYLLAQKNPYDPAFMRWWNLDASLYQGRYYIYWGPFPALIQAVGKSLLGINRIIGDQYLVFLFFCLMVNISAALIRRMAHRLATGVPPWLIAASVLGMGLANPVTFLLASAGVYQAAIAGSQTFLFLGIVFAFDAVWEPAHGLRRVLSLLFAGIAWSMAIGCRISVILAVAPIIFCTIFCTCMTETLRLRRFVRDGLWVSAPIALCFFGLLYYNKVRFDEWFEFGLKYQISAFPFRSSTSYILPNIETYFLRRPHVECNFPYVFATLKNGAGPISNLIGLPKGYLLWEPVVGMLYAVPLVYAAPVAVFLALRRARLGLFPTASARLSDATIADEHRQRRAYVWFVVCLVLAAVGPAYIPTTIYVATMRYLCDFTNAIVLLSILGLFGWYGHMTPSEWHRQLRATVTAIMLGVTIMCGLLLGYQGYVPYFKTHNPELNQVLVSVLSFCGDR